MDPDRNPASDKRIDRRLDRERWFLATRSAAYASQCAALRPKPWQPVPANEYVAVTDDDSEYAGDGTRGRCRTVAAVAGGWSQSV
jgi:hypothetical protein